MDPPDQRKRSLKELEPYSEDPELTNLSNHLHQLLVNASQTIPEDFPQKQELKEFVNRINESYNKAQIFDTVMNVVINDYNYPAQRISARNNSSNKNTTTQRNETQSAANSPVMRISINQRKNSYSSLSNNSSSRRKSEISKIPKKGDSEDEQADYRPRSNIVNSSNKRPVVTRTRTRTSETLNNDQLTRTPDALMRDLNGSTKPVNNRVSNLKDDSFDSLSPSAVSPLQPTLLSHDPNHISNLLNVSKAEPLYARNATKFQDFRDKMVVNEDFSKAKGTFSVPIQTFQNYAESYLRPLTEGDLKVLEYKELDPSLFEIPVSGRNYKRTWGEEDRDNVLSHEIKDDEFTPAPEQPYNDDPSFFTHRLYSALLPVVKERNMSSDEDEEEEEDDDLSADEAHELLTKDEPDPSIFEKRLKEELSGHDILSLDPKPEPEYDEITLTLIKLQTQLRDLNSYNNAKKKRLKKASETHLAYQEYNKIMDNFDSKLESSYAKRQSANKNRRKRANNASKGLPEGASQTLEVRNRVIKNIGAIFDSEEVLLPNTSIYKDIPCPESIIELLHTNEEEQGA